MDQRDHSTYIPAGRDIGWARLQRVNTFFPATVVPCEENGVFEPGEGDALHSFGPVAKASEAFSMKLGGLESAGAPL